MKEVTAYVRPERINAAIIALENAGIQGMTVIDVWALANWADPEKTTFSIKYVEKYCRVVKLELICADQQVEAVIAAICQAARTGHPGDGKVFVADIQDAVSIRTGLRGTGAL